MQSITDADLLQQVADLTGGIAGINKITAIDLELLLENDLGLHNHFPGLSYDGYSFDTLGKQNSTGFEHRKFS